MFTQQKIHERRRLGEQPFFGLELLAHLILASQSGIQQPEVGMEAGRYGAALGIGLLDIFLEARDLLLQAGLVPLEILVDPRLV